MFTFIYSKNLNVEPFDISKCSFDVIAIEKNNNIHVTMHSPEELNRFILSYTDAGTRQLLRADILSDIKFSAADEGKVIINNLLSQACEDAKTSKGGCSVLVMAIDCAIRHGYINEKYDKVMDCLDPVTRAHNRPEYEHLKGLTRVSHHHLNGEDWDRYMGSLSAPLSLEPFFNKATTKKIEADDKQNEVKTSNGGLFTASQQAGKAVDGVTADPTGLRFTPSTTH